MTKNNYSIRKKIFLYTSSISISFILLLFVIISLIYYNQIFDNETASAMNQLHYIEDQIEFFLTSADNYSKAIITNEQVQSIVNRYNRQPASLNALDKINTKKKILQTIQATRFIDSVTLYSPTKDIIISTDSTRKSEISDQLPEQGARWIVHSDQTEIFLSLLRPFYDVHSGYKIGYIQIAIPENEIYNIYKDKETLYSNVYIAINDHQILNPGIQDSDFASRLNLNQLVQSNNRSYKYTANSILFIKHFKYLDWYLLYRIDLIDFLIPMMANFSIVLVITILCIVVSLYLSKNVSHNISQPIYSLIAHTQLIKKGDWVLMDDTVVDSKNTDIEIVHLIQEFNQMIRARKKLEIDILKSEREKNKLFLNLLQEQIKPHFLYNTLDNICSLAELDEKDTLIQLVMNLSTFYRQSLSQGQSLITIKQELDIATAYIKILQIRYPNQFDYHIHCEPALYDCSCLKLLIQPIVENSIYHGIKEIDYAGYIQISVTRIMDNILIQVFDNGKGLNNMTFEELSRQSDTHYGIHNIDKRIKLQYGARYGLDMTENVNGGCISTITLPYQPTTADTPRNILNPDY